MNWDLFFKILAAVFGFVSVGAAVYNLVTAHRRGKQLAHENSQAAQLQETTLLATRTEERVAALEGRLGNFEQRIERRIDQIAGDIGKVKDLFTDYLIKH